MLRIGQKPVPTLPDPPPEVPDVPTDQPVDDSTPPTKRPSKLDIDKADATAAGYLGPEHGPFECDNCVFFTPGDKGPGECHLVSGPIDPQGCCNLFTKSDEEDQTDQASEPEGEPVDEAPEEPTSGQIPPIQGPSAA